MADTDEQFLRRAVRLAMNGRGGVEPNPMVGCVIVKDGRVIGEGFHARYGGSHAEPIALAACKEDPRGATVYVTLEPCCHLNKQTPPCAPRLIEAGIARVVMGCLDPNPDVNGKGVAMLREVGIVVDGPVLESECRQLIAPFITWTTERRPYITLKWAQTADGKIAGPGGRRMQISNEGSMEVVHRLRSRCDAVLVGINTVLTDDPQLTARGVKNPRPLLRCVLDRKLRTPLESKLVRTVREARVLIGCDSQQWQSAKADALRTAGVELICVFGRDEFLFNLRKQWKVSHLLVEPGPTLARAFFDRELADRLWIFNCARSADDKTAPDAAVIPSHFRESGKLDFDGDILHEYLNPLGPSFFCDVPSADLELELETGGTREGRARPSGLG